jgi:sigma-B regulation protein RsbQ
VDVRARNNVAMSGRAEGRAMIFAHGFGCDQHMWRHVAPEFETDYRVNLFDRVGAGGSELAAYDARKTRTMASIPPGGVIQ